MFLIVNVLFWMRTIVYNSLQLLILNDTYLSFYSKKYKTLKQAYIYSGAQVLYLVRFSLNYLIYKKKRPLRYFFLLLSFFFFNFFFYTCNGLVNVDIVSYNFFCFCELSSLCLI